MAGVLSLLVFGAHPDDCELTTGGLAALWTERGGRALYVSVTNGDAGHHKMGGAALARIRRREARAAAATVGAESIVLDTHDGELMPTLEHRREIIGIIRDFGPDLILCPRPNDYHPDHRYTSVIVQDAAYMVGVPNICAFHDRLEANPVVMYVSDPFQKPYPFQPDVVIDVASVIERKLDALNEHASQMYEWLPFMDWNIPEADVPTDPAGRRAFLRERWGVRLLRDAKRFRAELAARYGAERADGIVYAEAFEVCELGSPLTAEARDRLFPF